MIIDANRASDLLGAQYHGSLILDAVLAGRLKVHTCCHLTKELSATKLRGLLIEWLRSGRALLCPDAKYLAEYDVVCQLPLASDDHHIVALARASGCRCLYTEDGALISDFRDARFIAKPRGKVITPNTREQDARRIVREAGDY